MRMSRKAGLFASAAVCGALALGAAGEAIASMNDAPAHSADAAPRKAPLPHSETLKAQVKSLADIAGVLTPMTALINDVLTSADNGKLTPDQLITHSTAIKKAIATARQTGPATPSADSISQPDNGSRPGSAKAATNLRANALAGLQAKSEALLKAITAGDEKAVTQAVTSNLTALSNVIVSTTLGGLPTPDLPGLPRLPQLLGVLS
ncbi:hypothetical protein AB0D04_30900 [Streptomyces sp. NPDC048483]|uniref:hypothetical protein n=1 Tax=Streptomyces sp. NPDC048483 TaxID=3154927 RepID=UPI0034189C7B